jgi:hypothetical protein
MVMDTVAATWSYSYPSPYSSLYQAREMGATPSRSPRLLPRVVVC